jgi:hypothetical protein
VGYKRKEKLAGQLMRATANFLMFREGILKYPFWCRFCSPIVAIKAAMN